MSLSDRPKLSERLKGKTGDELFDEIKKEFENSKKNWFSRNPGFRSLNGEGFPFDNVLGTKSDAGIKSHLEDLAKKHPEFAGDLKCPPWGGTVDKNWDKAFTIPVAVEKEGANDQTSQLIERKEGESTPVGNIGQSTSKSASGDVKPEQKQDQKVENEPKRASSAPPSSASSSNESPIMNNQEPKRFTSKIEITPVNPFEEGSASRDNQSSDNVRRVPIMTANSNSSNSNNEIGSPRVIRRIPVNTNTSREIPVTNENIQNRGYESPQASRKQPQVHHIPIYVEGRKDPVMPKNTNEQPEQRKQFPQEQTPLKRKLDGNGNVGAKDNTTKQNQSAEPAQQNQESRAENREVPVERPAPTPTPAKTFDPMQRIQDVQQEVDNLTKRVEQFSSNSRTDKDYLYLDEMLTRNLIKLDTIEVEGNDELRTARRNVIKSIQKSIALLESKVPSPNADEKSEQLEVAVQKDESANSSNQMEIDNSDTAKSVELSDAGNDGKTEKPEF